MSDPPEHKFPEATAPARDPDWLGKHTPEVRPLELRRVGESVPPEPVSQVVEPEPDPTPEPPAPPPEPIVPPEVLAELEQRMRLFAEATIELVTARERCVRQLEDELLELSVAIASEIIERQLELDPELHASLAAAACRELGVQGEVRLRASELSYRALIESLGEPPLEVEGVRVEVTLDKSLEGLGCIADTAHAQVDGRVHERLHVVLEALKNAQRQKGSQAA